MLNFGLGNDCVCISIISRRIKSSVTAVLPFFIRCMRTECWNSETASARQAKRLTKSGTSKRVSNRGHCLCQQRVAGRFNKPPLSPSTRLTFKLWTDWRSQTLTLIGLFFKLSEQQTIKTDIIRSGTAYYI